MSWQAGQRIVAEPISATLSATAAAAGAHVHVDVSFRLIEWPWDERGPLSLVPQPCRTGARTEKGEVQLGFAFPNPDKVLFPPSHSATDSVRFTLNLSSPALNALEASRNGGSLELVMDLVAHPFFADKAVYPTSDSYSFRVPKEQWTAALQSAGYCETLVTELRLPTDGPEATVAGRRRLQSAVVARNDGNYGEAMRRSRMALDELKTGGFGGKAPSEVANFLQQRAGAMSSVERFSVLQIALQLFSSPAHHANAPDEHYIREQADLAIALAAALLRLAPTIGVDPQGAPDETP